MQLTRPRISPLEVALVKSVAAGNTQEAIAGQLRISERTVRRRLDDLCKRFGVESHLALGIMLGQLGLIVHDLSQLWPDL